MNNDNQDRFDAKKVLQKISGKRPGKPCGKSFIAADRKCGSHNTKTATGKRKLTEEGKKAAELLAAKVRARKGLAPKVKPRFKGKTEAERKLREEMYQILQRNRQWKKEGKRRREEQAEFDKRVENRGELPSTIGSSQKTQKGIKFTPLEMPKGMTPAERRAQLRIKNGAPDDGSRMGKLARQEEKRAIVGLGAEAEQPLGKRKREIVEKASERFGIEQSSKPKLKVVEGGKKNDRTLEELITEAQKIGAKYDDGTADLASHREAKKLVGDTVGKAFEKGKGKSAGDKLRESADKLKAENEVQKKATVRILTASAKIAANQDRLIDEAVDMANQDLGVKGGKTKREKSIAQMTLEAAESKQPEPKQPTAKGLSTRIRASADTLQAETEKQIKATSRILGATAKIASNQDKLIEEMSSLAESDLDAKTRRAKISRAKDDRPSAPTSYKRQSVANINAELRKKNGIMARKRSIDSADERIAVS